jgi:hypothetical protein
MTFSTTASPDLGDRCQARGLRSGVAAQRNQLRCDGGVTNASAATIGKEQATAEKRRPPQGAAASRGHNPRVLRQTRRPHATVAAAQTTQSGTTS